MPYASQGVKRFDDGDDDVCFSLADDFFFFFSILFFQFLKTGAPHQSCLKTMVQPEQHLVVAKLT